ncbi:hypothetical protein BGZ61DRAFT_416603 [Ilyonectria robusta]|uniref:uncharacterized protein n=1 Tax=Ilyonectria robusta TaxID=1079257 RepID=UPI001E8D612E|nr:uncharacterized protein BGZ61DRAFT_416603 [Ilyonectria robusta]KAH8722057.1 hypothetical protein BGZ61DRAFT_416603 [Ilyonectria robusta]
MFFGTPHGGADPRGFLLSIAEKAFRASGYRVNEQVVNSLLPSSERLRELRDVFGPIARERNWVIHSFQEQYGAKSTLGKKVVEDGSSCLHIPDIELVEHIGRDHMGMTRFTGTEDPEFKKVGAALRRMTLAATNSPNRRERKGMDEYSSLRLLQSLWFGQIDTRHLTIRSAHSETCRWVLRDTKYLNWLDPSQLKEHRGFLWIKGKPGAGKSTLMKFVLSKATQTMENVVIINFFFNARGDDLEKSTMGMYRSLLHQLLTRLRTLLRVFDSLTIPISSAALYQWNIDSLKSLFEQAIQSLGKSSVVCFIDALDECDDSQIRDMVSFFEHTSELAVSAGIKFQVCFSSRHYPHIATKHGLSLILEDQKGHSQDIANFVGSELKIGGGQLAQTIRAELQKKSSSVFLWVVLVVGILNKEYDRGRVHTLRQRLEEIPDDLHELFRDILFRDCKDQGDLFLCIQWVLFAKRPLKPEELYFAILSGNPRALSSWGPHDISLADMKRFILDCSKGLTEETKSKIPTIQFIHESVQDFLVKENGLGNIWPDFKDNLVGYSHDKLKQCCLNYTSPGISTRLGLDGVSLYHSSRQIGVGRSVVNAFPFLEYAVRNVLYHAEAAGNRGISQESFIQRFDLAMWTSLRNIVRNPYETLYTPGASLLYILAEANMPYLIRTHTDPLSCIDEEDKESYGCPFFAAIASKSNEALQLFWEALLESLPPSGTLRGQCNRIFQVGRSQLDMIPRFRFSFSEGRSTLSQSLEMGDLELFSVLLETGKFLPDSKDDSGRTPLSYAVSRINDVFIMKLLLQTGSVDMDSKDNVGRTPLSWVASCASPDAMQFLLKSGAVDVDSKDDNGRTPLSWAACGGRGEVINILLETGNANIGLRDNDGRSPLWWAAEAGDKSIENILAQASKTGEYSEDDDCWGDV